MKIPQQVTCQCSSENCSAVATNENQFIQVLDLQPIVQRVAKAMRPVKQRQETQCKQINSGERRRDQRMQILVAGSGNPSQGKRKPEEERCTGMTKAAKTPPALNSDHRTGSFECFTIYDLTRNQATTSETAAQAA